MAGSFQNLFHFYLYVGTHMWVTIAARRGCGIPCSWSYKTLLSFSYGLGTERGSSVRVANILGHWAVSADPTDRMSAEGMKAFLCLPLLLKPGCPSRENCVSHKDSLTSEAYSWRCASHWQQQQDVTTPSAATAHIMVPKQDRGQFLPSAKWLWAYPTLNQILYIKIHPLKKLCSVYSVFQPQWGLSEISSLVNREVDDFMAFFGTKIQWFYCYVTLRNKSLSISLSLVWTLCFILLPALLFYF